MGDYRLSVDLQEDGLHHMRIVNLEAAEQPEVFDLTPDEDSDRDEADEVFIDRYLTTKSPVKRTGKP